MPRRVSLARTALALAAVAAATVVATVLFLRADKRPLVREIAGELGRTRWLESSPTALGRTTAVELINHRGEAVANLWVRRPEPLAPDYRVVLAYTGERTGERIFELIPERDDLVLAVPVYPYRRPRGTLEHLRWPGDLRRAAFRTVAAGLLAVTYLEREEQLDLRRLIVIGGSLGSIFAVLHGALDPRVPRVVALHGGGDLPLVIRTIESNRGRPWRGRFAAGLATVFADSFDPLHYAAEISPRELVVIGAVDDRMFPAASTQALYDRAREPKSLRWLRGGHLRSRADEPLDIALAELESVLAQPLPQP